MPIKRHATDTEGRPSMQHLARLALAATLTIGTLVTAQSAGAFERYRAEGFDTAEFEPFQRTTSPTWTPTWSPTWTPEPQVTETPSPYADSSNYTAYPDTPGCLSGEQVADYARGAGFPEAVVPTMVAIADRESGWCAGAVNVVSGACGLWQIYPAQSGCTDPTSNAAMAYAKWKASGLSPWAM